MFICGDDLKKVMGHFYENGLKGHERETQGRSIPG